MSIIQKFDYDIGFAILRDRFGGRFEQVEEYITDEMLVDYRNLSEFEALRTVVSLSRKSARLLEAFIDAALSGYLDKIFIDNKTDIENLSDIKIKAAIMAIMSYKENGEADVSQVYQLKKKGLDFSNYIKYSENAAMLNMMRVSLVGLKFGVIVNLLCC